MTGGKEGCKQITIEEYDKLPGKEKRNWVAIYKTRQKKERDYCNECGHFTGWVTRKIPYGEPIGYRPKTVSDITEEIWTKKLVDSVLGEPVYKSVKSLNLL